MTNRLNQLEERLATEDVRVKRFYEEAIKIHENELLREVFRRNFAIENRIGESSKFFNTNLCYGERGFYREVVSHSDMMAYSAEIDYVVKKGKLVLRKSPKAELLEYFPGITIDQVCDAFEKNLGEHWRKKDGKK